MKAILQDTYGGPEVLELRDFDQPVASDDQVLARVHAAGLDRGGRLRARGGSPVSNRSEGDRLDRADTGT